MPIVADVDDGCTTGTLDGDVTIHDLLAFLLRFEAGCKTAAACAPVFSQSQSG